MKNISEKQNKTLIALVLSFGVALVGCQADKDVATDTPEEEVPATINEMTFFLTSQGTGNGSDLDGLEGADLHCQNLAEGAGSTGLVWRAYLSTSSSDQAEVNARDRIGEGPWRNANGTVVANSVDELHGENGLTKETVLTENGEITNGRGDDPNRHDILTGSHADGTSAVGQNCDNWTSSGEGTAIVGHHDRVGGGDNGSSWNSSHTTRGCSQEQLQSSGGDGLFYCFAAQ